MIDQFLLIGLVTAPVSRKKSMCFLYSPATIHFRLQIRGFSTHQAIPQRQLGVLQFSFDTLHLELVSDPTGEMLSPPRLRLLSELESFSPAINFCFLHIYMVVHQRHVAQYPLMIDPMWSPI